METVKNDLPIEVKMFFNELKQYIDKPLYFYGSIQRNDYLPNHSDIDIDIFSDNINSTLTKLQYFLRVKKSKFKKIIWKQSEKEGQRQGQGQDEGLIYGYKIFYKNNQLGNFHFSSEISIYDIHYKSAVLSQHRKKMNIPFYISWLLIFVKFLFYNIHIINYNTYKNIKHYLLSKGIGILPDHFITIPYSHKK
jgi:hypothetical protein